MRFHESSVELHTKCKIRRSKKENGTSSHVWVNLFRTTYDIMLMITFLYYYSDRLHAGTYTETNLLIWVVYAPPRTFGFTDISSQGPVTAFVYKPACEFWNELLNFATNFRTSPRSSECYSEKLSEIDCKIDWIRAQMDFDLNSHKSGKKVSLHFQDDEKVYCLWYLLSFRPR